MRIALILWLACAAVYAAFAGDRLLGPSSDPHFILQAEAFLQGQLELTRAPPHRNDWASYEVLTLKDGSVLRGLFRTSGRGGQVRRFRTLRGRVVLVESSSVRHRRTRTYVSFPSLPAVLMAPFVAALGSGFSDVVFTVIVAGLNVALVFLLLELLVVRGYSARTRPENVLLSLLFAFGTVHFWCSVLGQVWFTALILGVGLHTLYLMAALDARHPWLAGLCLGLGMATRTPLAFGAIFFGLQVILPRGRFDGWQPRRWLGPLLRFCTPVVIVGALLAAANLARFERIFEFGHTYLAAGTIERIRYHGLFGLGFVPRNLAAAFILLPALHRVSPWVTFSRHGMSVLLSTPPLAWLAVPGRRCPGGLVRSILVALAVVATPLLLYQNTGHIQYGYRFALDVMPLLVMLWAVRVRHLSRLFWALAIVGVLVNGFGAVTFKRYELLFDEHFPELLGPG